MKSYVWVTFAFLGWGYYEMSGGNGFEPETSPQNAVTVAALDPAKSVAVTQAPSDVVTRASTPELLTVAATSAAPASETADIVRVVAQAVQAEQTAPTATVVEAAAQVITPPPADIRQVAGSRVNMRIGPSTNHEVITTLDGGTDLEVLEVNSDGWARVLIVNSGYEGWMAERLLTAPQG